jgi:hypothetical protein
MNGEEKWRNGEESSWSRMGPRVPYRVHASIPRIICWMRLPVHNRIVTFPRHGDRVRCAGRRWDPSSMVRNLVME